MYNYNDLARFVCARSIVFCEGRRPLFPRAHYFYAGYSVIDIINELNRTIATQPLLTCALFLLFFFAGTCESGEDLLSGKPTPCPVFNVRVIFNTTEVPFRAPRIAAILSWDYPPGMYTIVGGQNIDPQSMDYPPGLPIWTTVKWTTPLKFSD